MESTDKPDVAVVIPTYNEGENIGRLLEKVLDLDLSLCVAVVDDNSPDGTADKAKAMGDSRVKVIHRTGPRGYGKAVRDGFRWAIESGADYVVSMDADFSHDPGRIPDLVRSAEKESDIVIGSRYCPDGGTINWPMHRIMLSRTANHYVRVGLGMPVLDATSGFRCYRRAVLEKLDTDAIRSEGYSFLVEVLYRCYLEGAQIGEIPILFVDRLKGKSKISTKEIYRSIFTVLRLRFSRRKNPVILPK